MRGTQLLLLGVAFAFVAACDRGRDRLGGATTTTAASVAEHPAAQVEPPMTEERRELLRVVRAHGIDDPRVLAAVEKVPRHELVPEDLRMLGYEDQPLPIGENQTISQPSLVARMTELAKIDPHEKVLEIGTGSGYQAAILAELTDQVYTIEIVEMLGMRAKKDLERLGYGDRIEFRIGDGYAGWKEAAPFDAIIVTAAAPEVPAPLKEQLAIGGRLVIPVGDSDQRLRVIERTKTGFMEHESVPVRFVPMTGKVRANSNAR